MVVRFVAAAMLMLTLVGCADKGGPTPRQQQRAHYAAGIYCTLDYHGSIYSEEFLRCVEDREAIELEVP